MAGGGGVPNGGLRERRSEVPPEGPLQLHGMTYPRPPSPVPARGGIGRHLPGLRPASCGSCLNRDVALVHKGLFESGFASTLGENAGDIETEAVRNNQHQSIFSKERAICLGGAVEEH